MTVRVVNMQGGAPLQANFADNFNRADDNNLGSNWIRVLGGNDTVTLEAWGQARLVSNEAVIQGVGENNPNAVLKTAWLPVPVMNTRVFNASKYFVQATFQGFVGTIGCALGIRYNQSHQSGVQVQPNGMDAYLAIINGRIDKVSNGSALSTIGANTVAIVAGNVIRIEVENSGTSTIITSYVNAAQVNQVTELAASFPIQQGWPSIVLYSVGGAPPTGSTMNWNDFSCGLF